MVMEIGLFKAVDNVLQLHQFSGSRRKHLNKSVISKLKNIRSSETIERMLREYSKLSLISRKNRTDFKITENISELVYHLRAADEIIQMCFLDHPDTKPILEEFRNEIPEKKDLIDFLLKNDPYVTKTEAEITARSFIESARELQKRDLYNFDFLFPKKETKPKKDPAPDLYDGYSVAELSSMYQQVTTEINRREKALKLQKRMERRNGDTAKQPRSKKEYSYPPHIRAELADVRRQISTKQAQIDALNFRIDKADARIDKLKEELIPLQERLYELENYKD